MGKHWSKEKEHEHCESAERIYKQIRHKTKDMKERSFWAKRIGPNEGRLFSGTVEVVKGRMYRTVVVRPSKAQVIFRGGTFPVDTKKEEHYILSIALTDHEFLIKKALEWLSFE